MSKVIDITTESFEQIITDNQFVMIKFGTSWCGPCKMMKPVLEDLSNFYDGVVTIADVDVDQCQELGSKFGVRSVPTTIFFKDGEVVNKHVGAAGASFLKEKLNSIIN